MVGPPSAADRAGNRRQAATWLVGLVTLSAGLSAAYSGGGPLAVAALAVVGAVVGIAVVVALGAWP